MALFITQDGSLSIYSDRYGVTYHSRFGAVTESSHVYIDAGLRYKAAVQRDITILEVGFGTGLNAFLTFLETEKRNLKVKYTGIEAYPLDFVDIEALNYPSTLNAVEMATIFKTMHSDEWNKILELGSSFQFEKQHVSIEQFQAQESYDLIYYDAFAPVAQPEMWTEKCLVRMFDALKYDGILVTYVAQGAFKRTLKQVGFQVEALQGPPGKREMTRAYKNKH